MDQVTPPERRADQLGREAFDLAVTSATKAATQEIARMHRVRLVTQSAALAFFAACVVFAIGAVIGYVAISNSAVAHARYNCRVLTRIAQIMGSGAPDLKLRLGAHDVREEGFLSSDTLLRQSQNITSRAAAKLPKGALRSLLTDPSVAKIERRNLALQRFVTDYWANDLSTQLLDIARVNCARRLH